MTDDLAALSTAVLSDACLRVGVPIRIAPPGIGPLKPGTAISGPVRPVRHHGSVDVFLEAIEAASPGEILVIDNGGRLDEGCIGDLIVMEAQEAGMAGVVVWGVHRDDPVLRRLGLPVFSYGRWPGGPLRLDTPDPDVTVRCGDHVISDRDVVIADADGVVFIDASHIDAIRSAAEEIAAVERAQADDVRGGRSLREQFEFNTYLDRRRTDAGYTFRKHLRDLGAAVEE